MHLRMVGVPDGEHLKVHLGLDDDDCAKCLAASGAEWGAVYALRSLLQSGGPAIREGATLNGFFRHLDRAVYADGAGRAVVFKALLRAIEADEARAAWIEGFELPRMQGTGTFMGYVLLDDVFPYALKHFCSPDMDFGPGWLHVRILLLDPDFGRIGNVTWNTLCVEFVEVEPDTEWTVAGMEPAAARERFPVGRMSYPVWFTGRKRRHISYSMDRRTISPLADQMSAQQATFFAPGTDVEFTVPGAYRWTVRGSWTSHLETVLRGLHQLLLPHIYLRGQGGQKLAFGLWFVGTDDGRITARYAYGEEKVAALVAEMGADPAVHAEAVEL